MRLPPLRGRDARRLRAGLGAAVRRARQGDARGSQGPRAEALLHVGLSRDARSRTPQKLPRQRPASFCWAGRVAGGRHSAKERGSSFGFSEKFCFCRRGVVGFAPGNTRPSAQSRAWAKCPSAISIFFRRRGSPTHTHGLMRVYFPFPHWTLFQRLRKCAVSEWFGQSQGRFSVLRVGALQRLTRSRIAPALPRWAFAAFSCQDSVHDRGPPGPGSASRLRGSLGVCVALKPRRRGFLLDRFTAPC